MKCHVCNGEHVYLAHRTGNIKMWVTCPHCKGTRKEPFDAQAELAELKRRVEALEQHKPFGVISDVKVTKRPVPAVRLMQESMQGINLNRSEREQITGYILALERKPTLPERPATIKYFAKPLPGSCLISPSEAKEIYSYVEALEKECGKC